MVLQDGAGDVGDVDFVWGVGADFDHFAEGALHAVASVEADVDESGAVGGYAVVLEADNGASAVAADAFHDHRAVAVIAHADLAVSLGSGVELTEI